MLFLLGTPAGVNALLAEETNQVDVHETLKLSRETDPKYGRHPNIANKNRTNTPESG
jgi:hypothetical protein